MNKKYKKSIKVKAGLSLLKIIFTLIGIVLLIVLIIYGLPMVVESVLSSI